MDYQVFLVTSMREAHLHGASARAAVAEGFRHASRVVTTAAIIMVAVFGGFVFNPEPMIKQVGFALAFGILIDAFLIRVVLIPATMAMVGEHAWWIPRWLDRLLPRLDIEGARLLDHLPPSAPAPEPVRTGWKARTGLVSAGSFFYFKLITDAGGIHGEPGGNIRP